MAEDRLRFDVSYPRRRRNQSFDEVLIAFRAGPPSEIVRVQQIIGHGTSIHYLGPGNQKFAAMVRVAEPTFNDYLEKHLEIVSCEHCVGVVTISAGSNSQPDSRPSEEHESMFLAKVSYGGVEAGNEYVCMYTLDFVKLTLVGDVN